MPYNSYLQQKKSFSQPSPDGAIPNFATEKEPKRNFLDFTDVTLVVVENLKGS